MSKARSWCFTLNNYEASEEAAIKQIPCKYLLFGHERGEQGTPHLQGFISFDDARTFHNVASLLPRAHIEVAKSAAASIKYCKKDGDFVELGEYMSNREIAQRGGEALAARWEEWKKLALAGKCDEIPAQYYVPHMSAFDRLAVRGQQHRENAPPLDALDNWLYFGDTGLGKSKAARADFGGSVFIKNVNKWWDGYYGEDTALIEDLDPDAAKCLRWHLKIWCDHYWFAAEVKFGTIYIRPKRIVITSQYTVEQLWHDDNETIQAMSRRLKVKRFAQDTDSAGSS